MFARQNVKLLGVALVLILPLVVAAKPPIQEPAAQPQQPPAPAAQPAILPDAVPQKIVVESVRGSIRFARNKEFHELTTQSELTRGDTMVAEAGAVCRLQFKHPTTGAILSAVVVRGYTEMTVAEAYQRGEVARTQLDVPQGQIRAGVRRTTTPPSFNVRSPRVVIGVRGTEIWDIRVLPWWDELTMGSDGVTYIRDSFGRLFTVDIAQGTRTDGDGPVMRPIDFEPFRNRVLFTGPWRDGSESSYDPFNFEPTGFNPGERWSDNSPTRDRDRNSGRPQQVHVPPRP